ncbi:MAG: sodium:proton antiporter, partial [Butyricicoccus sp.]|nr:sodium:proton antiporter [Butyricicoccus sp.]
MTIILSLLTNPVTVSVLVLCALCLTGLNVLLSMLIACIIGGVAGGIPLLNAPEGTQTVMQLLTGGFASNATT